MTRATFAICTTALLIASEFDRLGAVLVGLAVIGSLWAAVSEL